MRLFDILKNNPLSSAVATAYGLTAISNFIIDMGFCFMKNERCDSIPLVNPTNPREMLQYTLVLFWCYKTLTSTANHHDNIVTVSHVTAAPVKEKKTEKLEKPTLLTKKNTLLKAAAASKAAKLQNDETQSEKSEVQILTEQLQKILVNIKTECSTSHNIHLQLCDLGKPDLHPDEEHQLEAEEAKEFEYPDAAESLRAAITFWNSQLEKIKTDNEKSKAGIAGIYRAARTLGLHGSSSSSSSSSSSRQASSYHRRNKH